MNTPFGVSPASDDEDPSTLLLDFGEDIIVKRTVRRQLLVANQTAITAPFTIRPEYFSCHNTDPPHLDRRYQPSPPHLLPVTWTGQEKTCCCLLG